ncbi:MAG: methyltransferase domain-containing protein [Dehalococcoidia bacterium]
MNKAHLEFCSSDEWAESVRKWIIPGALANVELGDDVLEIGPGPGRTTDILKDMAPRLTAVEIDADLAAQLSARLAGTNVEVVHADATALPLPDGRFSAALSFTMLHHVPSVEEQDRLFAEVARVLRPGGVLAGVDSHDSPAFRALHLDDICVPLDPASLEERLTRAGFKQVKVDDNPHVVQFWASV